MKIFEKIFPPTVTVHLFLSGDICGTIFLSKSNLNAL